MSVSHIFFLGLALLVVYRWNEELIIGVCGSVSVISRGCTRGSSSSNNDNACCQYNKDGSPRARISGAGARRSPTRIKANCGSRKASPHASRGVDSDGNNSTSLTRSSSAPAAYYRNAAGFTHWSQGGGPPTAAHLGSGGASCRSAAFSFELLGQGMTYGAGGRDDDEPREVVGVVEEIEEIPQMPQLAEVVPFVGEAFRAGLVAPEQENEDGGLDLEFVYDAKVDQEEIAQGEEKALACIATFKVCLLDSYFERMPNVDAESWVALGNCGEVSPEVSVDAAVG